MRFGKRKNEAAEKLQQVRELIVRAKAGDPEAYTQLNAERGYVRELNNPGLTATYNNALAAGSAYEVARKAAEFVPAIQAAKSLANKVHAYFNYLKAFELKSTNYNVRAPIVHRAAQIAGVPWKDAQGALANMVKQHFAELCAAAANGDSQAFNDAVELIHETSPGNVYGVSRRLDWFVEPIPRPETFDTLACELFPQPGPRQFALRWLHPNELGILAAQAETDPDNVPALKVLAYVQLYPSKRLEIAEEHWRICLERAAKHAANFASA